MTFGQVQRATTTTDHNKLIKFSRSRDEKIRARVAGNPNTPQTVLEELGHDEDWFVVHSVAGNPSSPASLLIDLIFIDAEKGRNWAWRPIAERKYLAPEVLTAFSQSPAQAAISFISGYIDQSYERGGMNGPGLGFGLPLNYSLNPMVLEAFLEIKDSRRYKFNNSSFLSLYEVIASLDARRLTEKTMQDIAENGDVEAQRLLARQFSNPLPIDVLIALSTSSDWQVLHPLRFKAVLDDKTRQLIMRKLEANPEYREHIETYRESVREAQEQEALRISASRQPTQQKADGRKSAGTSRPQREFDSPVEEMFWDAYQKLNPKSLTGLVAQHWVGRYRLDFALPIKKIGIEIDGYEFHSGQKQFISDRQRQRNLEQKGWRITRFAAVEVIDDPEGCVRQAGKWVESQS